MGILNVKPMKILKYFSESPVHSPTVKRWQVLLFITVFVILMAIIYFFPINTRPSKEQIAQHKALINKEVDKVSKYIELDAGLNKEASKIIAYLILEYYWGKHEINPKEFSCLMVSLLGRRHLNLSTGDPEADKFLKKINKELKQELERSGIDPSVIEKRESLIFKVEFIMNNKFGVDVFNILLPSYEIERVNSR